MIPKDHTFPDGSFCHYWLGKDGKVHGRVFKKNDNHTFTKPESAEFTMDAEAVGRALARDRVER